MTVRAEIETENWMRDEFGAEVSDEKVHMLQIRKMNGASFPTFDSGSVRPIIEVAEIGKSDGVSIDRGGRDACEFRCPVCALLGLFKRPRNKHGEEKAEPTQKTIASRSESKNEEYEDREPKENEECVARAWEGAVVVDRTDSPQGEEEYDE